MCVRLNTLKLKKMKKNEADLERVLIWSDSGFFLLHKANTALKSNIDFEINRFTKTQDKSRKQKI